MAGDKDDKKSPSQARAFWAAIICGILVGASLPFIVEWVAGIVWLQLCFIVPILPCLLSRYRVTHVGIVANSSMSFAAQMVLV
jgi:hypothetical protein